MVKVLGTPDMPEEVGLSRPIRSFVANVSYSCRLMYAEGDMQHALKTQGMLKKCQKKLCMLESIKEQYVIVDILFRISEGFFKDRNLEAP